MTVIISLITVSPRTMRPSTELTYFSDDRQSLWNCNLSPLRSPARHVIRRNTNLYVWHINKICQTIWQLCDRNHWRVTDASQNTQC